MIFHVRNAIQVPWQEDLQSGSSEERRYRRDNFKWGRRGEKRNLGKGPGFWHGCTEDGGAIDLKGDPEGE